MTTVFTRTPVRITFVGGGSDLPSFYMSDRIGGVTVAAAINYYVNVIVHDSSENNFKVVYSQREVVENCDQIKHPAARAALQMIDVGRYIEVISLADVSSRGTGLGTSSSYVVGLVNALANYRQLLRTDNQISEKYKGMSYREWLARTAVHIERNMLKEAGGKQDQYIASYGGIQRFDFLPDEKVRVHKVSLDAKRLKRFQEHLLLINTGINRSSSDMHHANMKNDNTAIYSKMRDMAEQYYIDLSEGQWESTGEMLAKTWELKKKLGQVTTSDIDTLYKRTLELGAEGGKLLGAGMGGYLMVYAAPDSQKRIIKELGLQRNSVLRLKFDLEGSSTVYTNP